MLKNLSKSSVGDVNDKVMIVDGLNLFIRCFGAVPTLNDDGEHVGINIVCYPSRSYP